MRPFGALVWSLVAAGSLAFQDTSPFFLSSNVPLKTGELSDVKLEANVVLADRINSQLQSTLADCPTQVYILVDQKGVTGDDFLSGSPWLHLRNQLVGEHSGATSRIIVPDVHNHVFLSGEEALLKRACPSIKSVDLDVDSDRPLDVHHIDTPQIVKLNFRAPPLDHTHRYDRLALHDDRLNQILNAVKKNGHSYTLIFTTSPPLPEDQLHLSQKQGFSEAIDVEGGQLDFESEDQYYTEGWHTDLKRDLNGHLKRQANSSNDQRGLFEKYNYLSPGIFMAFFASFVLMTIAYIGLSALGSLDITHAAFNKEMGPSQQKKQ